MEKQATIRKAPRMVRWDVNSACNLSCKHCCVAENLRDNTIQDLSSDEFVDAMRKMAASGVKVVHFLGGEPTVRKDFLDLLRIANEIGLYVTFNTNGIRQDEKYLDAIFKYDVKKVVISLDGYDAKTHEAIRGRNTFGRTISFINKLVSQKRTKRLESPEIQLQSVLTSVWADDPKAMIDLAVRLHVNSLKINHMAEAGDAVSNLSYLAVNPSANFKALMTFLDASIEHPTLVIDAPIKAKVIQYYRQSRGKHVKVLPYECPAIRDNIYLESDGTVTPCQLAHMQGMGGDLPPINVTVSKAEELWNSAYFDRFVERIQNNSLDELYRYQVPCNHCMFLGTGCKPCPLPTRPGLLPTNYMCLIAGELIAEGKRLGGHHNMTETHRDAVVKLVVESNPPRSAQVTTRE